jgi:hypothetical protein
MARSLIPKGLNVLSFDLVSDGVFVVEADICEKIPLPGSEANDGEKSSGQGQVVDIVVCALSLMGTNWTTCIREAWRILKHEYVQVLAVPPVFDWFAIVENSRLLKSPVGSPMWKSFASSSL